MPDTLQGWKRGLGTYLEKPCTVAGFSVGITIFSKLFYFLGQYEVNQLNTLSTGPTHQQLCRMSLFTSGAIKKPEAEDFCTGTQSCPSLGLGCWSFMGEVTSGGDQQSPDTHSAVCFFA